MFFLNSVVTILNSEKELNLELNKKINNLGKRIIILEKILSHKRVQSVGV